MSLPVDVVLDYEMIGPSPHGIVVELSYVPFLDDPHNPPTFQELITKGRKYKFDIKKQPGRIKDAKTIAWWKQQDKEAQKILYPSADDLDLYEGHKRFLEDLKTDGVSRWQSFDYIRGPEFDRPILNSVIREMTGELDTFETMPFVFWNSRDVRTAIENRLLARGVTTTPLRRGMLDGFIQHDSIHDCAKDALMLIYALRYAMGIEDAPEGDEIDERSLARKR